MILRLLFFLSAVLVSSPAAAQAEFLPEMPALTTELVPEDTHQGKGTYVQAQLRLTLRLRGKHAYEALTVTLPEIADAEIITIQRPRTRFLDSYVGSGHIYEASYAIIPQRSGVLEIPPIRAVGRVTADNGEDLHFDLADGGYRVPVDPAVDGFSGASWFVADGIEISQTWSPDPQDIRTGDVLRREVYIKAFGTTGDRMPVLATPRASGATLLDSARKTETETTPGGTIGHLRQSWDIHISREVAEIAPVRLVYWNARTHAEEIAWLPVSRIEPLPADAPAIAARIMEEARAEHELQRTLWIELLAVLAAPFALTVLMFLYAVLPTIRDLVLYFRLARTSSPRQAFEVVRDWIARTGPTAPGDSELLNDLRALDAAIFSGRREAFHGMPLARRCLHHARRQRVARFSRRLGRVVEAVLGRRIDLGPDSTVRPH